MSHEKNSIYGGVMVLWWIMKSEQWVVMSIGAEATIMDEELRMDEEWRIAMQ